MNIYDYRDGLAVRQEAAEALHLLSLSKTIYRQIVMRRCRDATLQKIFKYHFYTQNLKCLNSQLKPNCFQLRNLLIFED